MTTINMNKLGRLAKALAAREDAGAVLQDAWSAVDAACSVCLDAQEVLDAARFRRDTALAAFNLARADVIFLEKPYNT